MDNNNWTEVLYKYRTIDNFRFFSDIILNNRLFAAKYNSLNDPMEGHYLYHDREITEQTRNLIYSNKENLKICSVSKDDDNFLMWSHYANGHKGVAIGVRFDRNRYRVKDIDYSVELPHITAYNSNTAEDILSKKLDFWNYEKEVRVFTNAGNFIEVKIDKIIVGSKMSDQDYGFISKLVRKINPEILIRRKLL